MIELIIKGRVASKKNSKRLAYSRVKGRTLIIPSKVWLKYERSALDQITNQLIDYNMPYPQPPYHVEYTFHMKGKGATDLDNMIAGVNDVLQRSGVLEDDMLVRSISASKIVEAESYMTEIKVCGNCAGIVI